VWFDIEGVFRAGFEQSEQVLDDGGGRVVSVEVYQSFAADWWGVNKGGLLSIVDEVARVDA
jgi:hypothetical protein